MKKPAKTTKSNNPLPLSLEAYYSYTHANACSQQGYVKLNHLHSALHATWEEGTREEPRSGYARWG